jgi:TonB-linked SusC/RagA family outer membrane protein
MKKLINALILLLFFHLPSMAQVIVTGKVTDSRDGSPLSGVTIQVKGGQETIQSGRDGSFRISLPGRDRILVFSYVGYGTEEVSVGNRTEITISLTTEERRLQEVVVVAYGLQDRRKITGSVAKLDGKEFENIPMPSVDQMLQGKVAGLQSVAGSGQPGALQEIRIRGIGSINASSEPLFVIDGVPVNTGDFSRNTTTSNALAGLNPNDIESISVLKDASAAALYGSRAANGVILITTRKGRPGKTKIGINSEVGFSDVSFVNDQSKPLTGAEYYELTHEGLVNAGLDSAQASGFLKNVLGAEDGFDTNWFDLVTRRGNTQQYNLSASGGDAKTTFYVSGSYFKQQAVVISSDFTRYSGNLNLRHVVSEKIAFGLSLNASNLNQNTPTQSANFRNPVLGAYFLRPFQHPYNSDGSLDYSPADFSQIYNPLAINRYDKEKLSNTKLLGTVSGEYNILKGLKFMTKYGIDYFAIEEPAYYNPFFGDAVTRGGDLYNYYTRVFNWVWTNTLDYHRELDKDGDLVADLKLGYE